MAFKIGSLLAIPLTVGMLAAAPAAHADWRGGWHGGGGWHEGYRGGGWGYRGGGWGYRPHYGAGPLVAGALLGLGVGAVVGGALSPPPVYYAPPPPVYYAPPPAYYAPPPAYYAPPAYYYYGR